MLVGTRTIVDVHSKVFSKELSGVTVAHDDALQIRLQQTNHINLHLLDKIAHAILGRPHVVVEREVNRPDASREKAVLGVVRLVVVGREAQEVGGEEQEVENTKNAKMILPVVSVDRTDDTNLFLAAAVVFGLVGNEIKEPNAECQHHGDHDPVSMLPNQRATRHKGIGDNPDVEENQEIVNEEAETKSGRRALLGSVANHGNSDGHEVGSQSQATVVTTPLLIESKVGSTNAAQTVCSPARGKTRSEDADENTSSHGSDCVPAMDIGNRSSDRITIPNPEDHGAGVREKGMQTEEQTANSDSRQNRRSTLLPGRVATLVRATASEPQGGKNSKEETSGVPATVLSMHDGPDGIVCVPSKLGNRRHEQTNGPRKDASLKSGGLHRVRIPGSSPAETTHGDAKANSKEPVNRVLDQIGEKASE